MAAALLSLSRGQRGRNEARKRKSRCISQPARRLHRVLSVRFQLCYLPAPRREPAAVASLCPACGALRGGV